MKVEFKVEYLSEEEKAKPEVSQRPAAAQVSICGEQKLVDALTKLIKGYYNIW